MSLELSWYKFKLDYYNLVYVTNDTKEIAIDYTQK